MLPTAAFKMRRLRQARSKQNYYGNCNNYFSRVFTERYDNSATLFSIPTLYICAVWGPRVIGNAESGRASLHQQRTLHVVRNKNSRLNLIKTLKANLVTMRNRRSWIHMRSMRPLSWTCGCHLRIHECIYRTLVLLDASSCQIVCQ